MIKPLKDNIIIKVHKIPETAIIMADDRESEMEKATVVAIGEEVQNVKEGDVIYFKNYETDSIVDGKNKYVIIKEESVKALYHE